MTIFQQRVGIKILKSATAVTLHENKKMQLPLHFLRSNKSLFIEIYGDWKHPMENITLSYWECYSGLFVRNVYNLQIDLLLLKHDPTHLNSRNCVQNLMAATYLMH